MSTIREARINTENHKNYKVHFEVFNSAEEVVKTCMDREITSDSFHDMKVKTDYDEWEGVKSYEEALDLLRVGYQPTVDAMKSTFRATIAGERKRFQFENQVHGFAPIVPLALKGVPNSMMNMAVRPIKTKVVNIYYDMTFASYTESEEIIEAGRKMLEVVVELEKQGYRFNLYGMQTYSKNDCDMMVVKVKSAEQPLDLKRISFPMTHTAFFRVIGFDWYSKVPGGKYRYQYGRGMAYNFNTAEMQDVVKQLFGKNAVYFAGKDILNKDKDYITEVVTNGKCEN